MPHSALNANIAGPQCTATPSPAVILGNSQGPSITPVGEDRRARFHLHLHQLMAR